MDITSMIVARVYKIDGEDARKDDRNPRIAFLNARFVEGRTVAPYQFWAGPCMLQLSHLKVVISQSCEVIVCHKDLGIDIANVWFRDYCGTRGEGLKGLKGLEWGEAIELVWDGKCYRELGATEPGEGLFMFGSSYGGDGIKLPIATKLGTRSIFYKEGEGDEEGSIKRPPMGFQMGMKA
jgi:hypothetical protein